MKSNYKKLGQYVRLLDNRNKDGQYGEESLKGISVTKEFIASHANLVGVSFNGYKIVENGQFAYMHFAPVSGHWCVCQWPLGATSGRKLIDHFVFDHNVIMFCYPLEQRVG